MKIYLIALIIALLMCSFIVLLTEQGRKVDCSIAGFSPDYSQKMREECRK